MDPEGFKILGEIVTRTETKQLDISECDPGWEELKNFKDSTRHANKVWQNGCKYTLQVQQITTKVIYIILMPTFAVKSL